MACPVAKKHVLAVKYYSMKILQNTKDKRVNATKIHWRIDVSIMSFRRHVPAGFHQCPAGGHCLAAQKGKLISGPARVIFLQISVSFCPGKSQRMHKKVADDKERFKRLFEASKF